MLTKLKMIGIQKRFDIYKNVRKFWFENYNYNEGIPVNLINFEIMIHS